VEYQKVILGFQTDLNEGLKVLFECYGQQLFGFSVTHFHINEDDGYDVLYKTMETVGRVIARYEFSSESHFRNWLFKIHKNNILQLLRTKKNKEQHLQIVNYKDWENEVKDLGEENFNMEEYKLVLEQISAVNPYQESPQSNKLMLAMEKALLQLNDMEKELLLLRMNDYSYDEIATMLGIENNQLKVKFNRAKAKLEKRTLEILNNTYNETR
jgi:RNA polymerase sigma-70 factor (ECF subfamily)